MESRTESRQRSGNKRHSGIQEPRNGQHVQRRPSKKSTSQDRHGHVYPDEITVRAVTPDPAPKTIAERRLSGIEIFSPSRTATPSTSERGSHPRIRDGTPSPRQNGSLPPKDKDKASRSRPRTRTLEERFREKSPPTIVSKTRQRIGSLHSSPQLEPVPSIGYPSVIPSPPLESQMQGERRRLVKPHSRQLSPIRNPSATKRSATQPSHTDAGKILQLMKITCGRMHGILSFRTSTLGKWQTGYCAINVGSGSLIYQKQGDVAQAKTLIEDLRGCQVRTLYDGDSHSSFLDVGTKSSNSGIHLRPHVPETFDQWLAALLCWQPIRPKGLQNKSTKAQSPLISGPRQASRSDRHMKDRRRNSEIVVQSRDAAIIKVGKMLMWDKDFVSRTAARSRPQTPSTSSSQRSTPNYWRKVSCTLQENGQFKLFTESDVTLLDIVPLCELTRCAIQRLDPSILDDEFSLAIYPHYTSSATTTPKAQTIYLSMDSRVLFEVWFVLLRAFTVPEMYGPESISVDPYLGPFESSSVVTKAPAADMFRVERQLFVRIIEAKMHSSLKGHPRGAVAQSRSRPASKDDSIAGSYFAEVLIDGDVRGKTQVKNDTSNPFWREDFELVDLPAVISNASITLKTQNSSQRDWTLVAHSPYNIEHENINPLSVVGDIEISPLDLVYGKVDFSFDDVERSVDTEKWWPIRNEFGEVVGDLLMKIRLEELVVLMGRDYQPLSELIHAFSTTLTNQMAQAIHSELRRLSEILLNIFQVSAQASDWIMSLVEDEIDNIHKDTPMTKYRYGRRIASNDSYESAVDREMFLRDLGKSATTEANLLFRGNTLLTKALDLHMQRLGKEYLEEILSEKMRDIDESDPECEVDPNRVQNPNDLERNWRNLIALTENIWKSIFMSANRCPPELRMIFRHIRACADDRYGSFHRTVTYSSVSGFLFLRFFVPAVLNPKLFGLLKGILPPERTSTASSLPFAQTILVLGRNVL